MATANYEKWKFLGEARKARKCPILDFGPLRESELYQDVIGLGFVEVNAQGVERVQPALEIGKTDLKYQVQFQGEKQGNLRFKHVKFPEYTIRLNINGKIWKDFPSGRAEMWDTAYDESHWNRPCLNLEDYKNRLEFLIKMLLHHDKFITYSELLNKEGGVEIIKRKIEEDPQNIKILHTIPPSLKDDHDYIKTAADFGLI
jgi:hypothetical protein